MGGFIGNKPVSRPKLNEICNVRIDRIIPRFGRILVFVIDPSNKTIKYASNKNNVVKKKIFGEESSIVEFPRILELSVESKNKINEREADIKPIQGRNSRNLARLGYTRN